MLARGAADVRPVIHRVLVLISLIACGLVLASFGLFVLDQVSGASRDQVNQLATTAQPTPAAAHPHRTGQPRRFIEGAARTLTSPFDQIVPSDNAWVRHGMPAIAALLVYGVGLGFLARFSRGWG